MIKAFVTGYSGATPPSVTFDRNRRSRSPEYAVTLLFCCFLYGCATDERINEYKKCATAALNAFPVNLSPQNYMEKEYFQKQEGMTCQPIREGSHGAGGMVCEPNMRTYERNVQKTRMVDANINRRTEFIENCTNRQCLIKYGNTSCEPK